MHTRPLKIVALLAAVAFALSLGMTGADAAKKKKKKRHYHRAPYSQQQEGLRPYYPPGNAGHNQCMHDQFRYPALDIRCR